MTLRRRLYVAMMLVTGVLAAAGFLIVHLATGTEIGQVDKQLRADFPVFATPALKALAIAHASAIQQCFVAKGPSVIPFGSSPACAVSAPAVGNSVYEAVLAKGRVQYSFRAPGLGATAPRVPRALSLPNPAAFKITTVGSKQGSQLWRAVLVSKPPGGRSVLLAVSLAQADASISSLRLVVIVAGIIVFLVLGATALWIGRLGLRPIAELTEAADAIAAGDRLRRVAVTRPSTEVGHLARAFNVMLDERDVIEARLRQFVADASHELRTPLSAITGIAELWGLGRFRAPDDADDAMGRIRREGHRMSHLVNELLTLAHLDERHEVPSGAVDLSGLVGEVVAELRTAHPGRVVDLDVDSGATVVGDEPGLRKLVANLVTNALVHTPSASVVAVRVRTGGHVELEVADQGPGMAEDEVGRAFDRFWRGDASRSRPGNGLGLSIVAGLAQAYRAELRFASSLERGTTVGVRFPPVSSAKQTDLSQ